MSGGGGKWTSILLTKAEGSYGQDEELKPDFTWFVSILSVEAVGHLQF
jgi:hypothetical protein